MSFARIGNSLPFSRLFRQLEQDMETVVKVLQPGPLGIIEHKFSAEEVYNAKATVDGAVDNWRRNAILEKRSHILEDYIRI
ncbi:PREDICTED: uncharacterized protein LOC104587583 [Nelumbo nucifera]|uniref:Zinc metalloproteinase aureolysin n=2 Tax=Nelumbo nucifera TaxID=4432 RepID=A0A822YZP6_NELNU|nr:PREDICTED: uncharacterized protein LOC104587583 [Nelumbo nucifera]DAD37987.1 TPA_asm: hypothetical protein HUJ06_008628 [Nelumbo nucifera]